MGWRSSMMLTSMRPTSGRRLPARCAAMRASRSSSPPAVWKYSSRKPGFASSTMRAALARLAVERGIGREVNAGLEAESEGAPPVGDFGERHCRARLQPDRAREMVVLQQRVVDVVADRAGELVGFARAIEAALGA